MKYFGTAAIITIVIGIKLIMMTKTSFSEHKSRSVHYNYAVFLKAILSPDRALGTRKEKCDYIPGSKKFASR